MADPIKKNMAKDIAVFFHGYSVDHTYFNPEDIHTCTGNIPWTRITFKDAPCRRNMFWWRSFNLGQIGDAIQIISLFWDIHQHGYTSITAMGHSLGGSALISALHIVMFPEKHKKTWCKIKSLLHVPEYSLIKKLQKLIMNSNFVFLYPMLSLHIAAYHKCRRRYHLSHISSKLCARTFRAMLSIGSSFSIQFDEPIELLRELLSKNIHGLIILCENDKIVSNDFDKELLNQTNNHPTWKAKTTDGPNHFSLKHGYSAVQSILQSQPETDKNLQISSPYV